MANPFIWNKLRQPGQPVPPMFAAFATVDTSATTQPQATIPHATAATVPSGPVRLPGPVIMQRLSDIVRNMLGHEVCDKTIAHTVPAASVEFFHHSSYTTLLCAVLK
jgi:hypothetical protein